MSFNLRNMIEMGFFVKGVIRRAIQSAEFYIKNELVEHPREGFICEQEVVEMVANDPRYDPQEVDDFDLDKLFQVFIILAVGLSMSALAVLLENGLHHRGKVLENVEIVRNYVSNFEYVNPINVWKTMITRTRNLLKIKKKRNFFKRRKNCVHPHPHTEHRTRSQIVT